MLNPVSAGLCLDWFEMYIYTSRMKYSTCLVFNGFYRESAMLHFLVNQTSAFLVWMMIIGLLLYYYESKKTIQAFFLDWKQLITKVHVCHFMTNSSCDIIQNWSDTRDIGLFSWIKKGGKTREQGAAIRVLYIKVGGPYLNIDYSNIQYECRVKNKV